jgi:hypothetical protein
MKNQKPIHSNPNKNSDQNQEGKELGYTPEENPFADGKGTQLNDQIAPNKEDIEDELSQQFEDTFEDQEFGEDQSDEQSNP